MVANMMREDTKEDDKQRQTLAASKYNTFINSVLLFPI